MTRILFFGVRPGDKTGHSLWIEGFKDGRIPPTARGERANFPPNIDGGFAPLVDGKQVEGAAAMAWAHGWTIVAWWDRSADTRPGSNAAFLAWGRHSFDAVMHAGNESFRGLLPRMGYDIVCPQERRLFEPAPDNFLGLIEDQATALLEDIQAYRGQG